MGEQDAELGDSMHRLGIDIGSKTLKVALLDEEGQLVYSTYIRHFAKVQEKLTAAVHDCIWRHGDMDVEVTVTGSAGMRVAELFDVPFVQEVVALKRAVQHFMPATDVVLEMGGEDTKLIYLTGVPEQRMNTICAGGTGGFIDMMAGLMGKRNEDMQKLALGAKTIYPIASRCAVFAQSDVRPLLNAGARKEDVAASVLEAVCTQAVAGLSCGRPIEGTVALLGGPFFYTPALKTAFCRVTGIDEHHAIIPANAHLFVVQGAAMSPEKSQPIAMKTLERMVDEADFSSEEGISRLPQLFANHDEYEQFRMRHASCKIPRAHLVDCSENLFLGIDAGSTTMKMALIDESGALCAYEYDWNEGDVTISLDWMLKRIYRQMGGRWIPDKTLRRSCIVGYGEDFCRAAYGIDTGEVETVAHLRAATALNPDVDFLMDIGGQDIKCFYVKDGVINDIVLNEACSSGCGSLFDSVARSMRKTKEGLATEALYAPSPVDLGTRCSVFMDSRVKHAQKEGVSQGDIAAGVVYATARNALYKVVRQPDFSKVGKHVMVQGGAFANDALLRVFEMETKTEVMRPDLAQLMGAWGAALLARDEWMSLRQRDPQAAEAQVSSIVGPEELKKMRIKRTSTRCEQCTNVCKLMVTHFYDGYKDKVGRTYVTGNRCEKGAIAFDAKQESAKRPPNMMAVKNALLAAYDRAEQPSGPKVGIPRALALYESYPFWKTFFNELGCTVVPGSESDDAIFRKGMASIPAEGACYPSKLSYGHCVDLVEKGAEALFVPALGLGFAREGLLGMKVPAARRDCPLIERMPNLIADNSKGTVLENVPLIAPDLLASGGIDDIADVLAEALAAAGIPRATDEVARALAAAQQEYRTFFAKLAEQQQKVLKRVDAGEFPGALVNGHAYHADPGISHGIDRLLGDLGYAVFEQVDYEFAARAEWENFPWAANRDLLHAASASAEHPNLQFIVLRSFGCGIDALVADKVHDELRNGGRIFAELKLDQIVDLAAIRIRLRSLAYAIQQRNGEITLQHVELGEYDVSKDVRFKGASAHKVAPRAGMAVIAKDRQLHDVNTPGGTRRVQVSTEHLQANREINGLGGKVDIGQVRSEADGFRALAPGVDAREVTREEIMAIGGRVVQINQAKNRPHISVESQAGTVDASTVGLAQSGNARNDTSALVAAMKAKGYEFIVDRTGNSNMSSYFMGYVIFTGPNGASEYFKNWDEVEAFTKQ